MSLLPRSRWSPLAAAALLGVALVACGDPFEVRATIATLEDTLVVNSVGDASAPIAAPMSIDIADQPNLFDAGSRRPVARRLGPEFYDIGGGFDTAIDVQGDSVVFLPPRLLTTALSTVRRVGLRRDTVAFDSIRVAPGAGYVFDTVRVAARVGQTVTIVSRHPVCAREISAELYAKVGVIAIDPAARTATLRVRLDPNCGFRSFLPGVPRR
jgi:hypothetical protein